MHERMLVFALREGELLHVRDVATGKACQCVCPACGEPLIAVNQGTKRAPHFRHGAHADCATGYESSLHLAGKEALLRLKTVMLPAFRKRLEVRASDGTLFAETLTYPARTLEADSAWEELWMGRFRPDVVFQVKGVRLLIEVKVTHAVDEAKLEKVRALGISAIELDLSLIGPDALLSQQSFDAFVVSSPGFRQWLFNRKGEMEQAGVIHRLQTKAAAYEPTARRRLAAHRARTEQDQQNRNRTLAPYQQSVRQLREQLAPQLRMLAQLTASPPAAAREYPEPTSRPERYQGPGLPQLFAPVDEQWAFEASPDDWQAGVLDLMFPGADRRETLSLRDLAGALIPQFGQPQFVTDLRSANREAVARCRAVPLLTPDEYRRLPSPSRAIREYMRHLIEIGLVTSKQHYSAGSSIERFRAKGVTVQEAWCAMAKQINKQARRDQQHEERELLSLQQERFRRLAAKPVPEVDPAVAARVREIRASELWLHEVHGGHGCRCSSCHMVMPQQSASCPFCRARAGGQQVLIDLERLAMAPHLLPKSPAVTASLTSVQSLDLSGLVQFMERLDTNR